jgi:putative zinc finger protein
MNTNHASAVPPEPGPLCAVADPLLPLLYLGELEPEQAMWVREHMAGCEWCERRLREYETVDAALHHLYAPTSALASGAAPTFSWERIISAVDELVEHENIHEDEQPNANMLRQGIVRRSWSSTGQRRLLTNLSALAAALLLVVLAGSLFARLEGLWPGAGPTLDPQSQAYVSVLRNYYQPVFVATSLDTDCQNTYGAAAPSRKLAALLNCRATAAAAVTSAQALSDHLASASPPARWQTADAALKQAAAATVAVYNQRVAAIDAHDTAQFDALGPQTASVLAQYCGPIAQINADLPPGDTFNGPKMIC